MIIGMFSFLNKIRVQDTSYCSFTKLQFISHAQLDDRLQKLPKTYKLIPEIRGPAQHDLAQVDLVTH
jgi:heme oxygenase